MKKYAVILLSVFSLLLAESLLAQVGLNDLMSDIEAGRVSLISTCGNGNSSGGAIEGSLKNETMKKRHFATNLSPPLYFKNNGSGQDMVATKVFLEDGGYFTDGFQSYITVGPFKQKGILFIAYCIEFDKDNPTANDSFYIKKMPLELEVMFEKISEYAVDNPETDLTLVTQVAIWLKQGKTMGEIRKRFDLTPTEEEEAKRIFQNL